MFNQSIVGAKIEIKFSLHITTPHEQTNIILPDGLPDIQFPQILSIRFSEIKISERPLIPTVMKTSKTKKSTHSG